MTDFGSEYVVVLVTARSENEAKHIARTLLEKRLIACAHLVPIQTLIRWEDNIYEENEVMLILKSTSHAFQENLIAAIKAVHSYDVPEIIGMPIVLGSTDYLRCLAESVK